MNRLSRKCYSVAISGEDEQALWGIDIHAQRWDCPLVPSAADHNVSPVRGASLGRHRRLGYIGPVSFSFSFRKLTSWW